MSEIPLFLHDPNDGLVPAAPPSDGSPVPLRAAGAERRILAVLFADVSNSTALYAELGDARAKASIDECFACISMLLPEFDGRLVKTIGDEVLCVFPTADQAVLAASEMQVAIAGREFGGRPIQLHIGLHCGPALLSVDDVHGDTVNVACYLTAVAGAEQIIASEATAGQLSPALKRCVRPVFRARLKGAERETTVYQVLWSRNDGEITETSLELDRRSTPDMSSLMLEFGNQVLEVKAARPMVRIGRSPRNDLMVDSGRVSRNHLMIQFRRTHFHLVDQSINGTWITSATGDECQVLRAEVMLSGAGVISLGSPQDAAPERRIVFRHDRRSGFRLSDASADVLMFPGRKR